MTDNVNLGSSGAATPATRISDPVSHPSHYAEGWSNGAEVIDITENLNFNRGNAVKYIARAGVKDLDKLVEDLFKAQWYLEREIKRITQDDDFFVDHMTAEIVPRVWDSLTQVPVGLPVIDREGDPDTWYGEGTDGSTEFDLYGPFTEVLGDA